MFDTTKLDPYTLAIIQIIGGIVFVCICGVCFVCCIERRKHRIRTRNKNETYSDRNEIITDDTSKLTDNINNNQNNIVKIIEMKEMDRLVPLPKRNRLSSKSTLNLPNHLHNKQELSNISNETSISDLSISGINSSLTNSDIESISDISVSDDSDDDITIPSMKGINIESNITQTSINIDNSDISRNVSNKKERPLPPIIRRSTVNNHTYNE